MTPEPPKLTILDENALSSEVVDLQSMGTLSFAPQSGLLPPPPSVLKTPPEAIIVMNPEQRDNSGINSGNFGKLVRRASKHFKENTPEAKRQSIKLNFYEVKPSTADSMLERSEDWYRWTLNDG